MINHSGQFERVGGKGHFLPSLEEAAQAVKLIFPVSLVAERAAITSRLVRWAVAALMTPAV